ncbi:MAG: hypothetical protein R2881_06215 [Eubacteriales bacterium]
MLPYVVTMIILILTSKKSRAPKAEGIPYGQPLLAGKQLDQLCTSGLPRRTHRCGAFSHETGLLLATHTENIWFRRAYGKILFRYGARAPAKPQTPSWFGIITTSAAREHACKAQRGHPRWYPNDSLTQRVEECILFTDIDWDKVRAGEYDCIIIDEAQFLSVEQVDICCPSTTTMCRSSATALRPTFAEFFPGSAPFLARADTIEEVKTICWCGKRRQTTRASTARAALRKLASRSSWRERQVYRTCRKHWLIGDPTYQQAEDSPKARYPANACDEDDDEVPNPT